MPGQVGAARLIVRLTFDLIEIEEPPWWILAAETFWWKSTKTNRENY